MQEIVFLGSLNLTEEPFTTDEIIANYSGNNLKSVKNLIRQYKNDLEEFGVLPFEKVKPPKKSKGGRPRKIYHLNEQQASVLITYLDNTEAVRSFKKELVRQFFKLKQEQLSRAMHRQNGKETRLSLTDAIQKQGFSDRFYYHFTNLCYKTAIGYTAKQIREARGVKKYQSPLDYLTSDELQAITQREQQIAMLIELGMTYEQIKNTLAIGGVIYQTTLQMKPLTTNA